MSVRTSTPKPAPAPARAHRLDDVLRIGMSMVDGGGTPYYYALVNGEWRRFEGLPLPYPRRSDDIAWWDHPRPHLIYGPEGGLNWGNAYVEISPNRYVPYDDEQARLYEERRAAARQRAVDEMNASIAAEEAANNENNMPENARMEL